MQALRKNRASASSLALFLLCNHLSLPPSLWRVWLLYMFVYVRGVLAPTQDRGREGAKGDEGSKRAWRSVLRTPPNLSFLFSNSPLFLSKAHFVHNNTQQPKLGPSLCCFSPSRVAGEEQRREGGIAMRERKKWEAHQETRLTGLQAQEMERRRNLALDTILLLISFPPFSHPSLKDDDDLCLPQSHPPSRNSLRAGSRSYTCRTSRASQACKRGTRLRAPLKSYTPP